MCSSTGIEAIEKANPPELVGKYRAEIETYAYWLNQGMAPGATSLNTYIPDRGLPLDHSSSQYSHLQA